MTEPDLICEICGHWQVVQDVRRDEPRPNFYTMYTNTMQCEKGHTTVVNRRCTDFYGKNVKNES